VNEKLVPAHDFTEETEKLSQKKHLDNFIVVREAEV